jgi:hypothetical protein
MRQSDFILNLVLRGLFIYLDFKIYAWKKWEIYSESWLENQKLRDALLNLNIE